MRKLLVLVAVLLLSGCLKEERLSEYKQATEALVTEAKRVLAPMDYVITKVNEEKLSSYASVDVIIYEDDYYLVGKYTHYNKLEITSVIPVKEE